MAIAGDAATIHSTWQTTTSAPALTHTCTGSNLILFGGVETYNSSLITANSVAYNGVAMTLVDSITSALESNNQDTELWYLDGPATGAHSIAATLSGTASFARLSGVSFTGKTVSGIDASAKSQNTSTSTSSPACNVTVNHSDCWLAGVAQSRDAHVLTAGSGTSIQADGGEGSAIGHSGAVVGTGSQTLNFNCTTASTWPGVVSASFSAANAGGGGGTRLVKMASEWSGYAGSSGGFAG